MIPGTMRDAIRQALCGPRRNGNGTELEKAVCMLRARGRRAKNDASALDISGWCAEDAPESEFESSLRPDT